MTARTNNNSTTRKTPRANRTSNSSQNNQRLYRLYSGWRRDTGDHRDLPYTPRRKNTPKYWNLRSKNPPIYNQAALGSCTGNGIGRGFHYDLWNRGIKDFMPSRLFIYYNERELDGTINDDAGSEIRTGIKTIAKQGVCSEALWPYDISKFKDKPTDACYAQGLKYRAIKYMRVEQDLVHLKACLVEGFPIVFGFNVFTSFESAKVAKTGVVPMPKKNEKNIGGHCMVIVGYDDDKQCFIIANSWGEDWGDQGYCYMPYAYITDNALCDDFWTIRVVSAATAARAKRKAHELAKQRLAA